MSQNQQDKTSLYDNMRKFINIIDELKDVGVQQYIQLPRIAVIGTQSAGKSSLLEAIVGLDFLPRGQGVVTRRPLELRLVHVSPQGQENFKPYAEFPNEGKQKYYDFDRVREKIIELTDKAAGKNKGIIDDALTMTIYSTTCPDLTLVDLPGITKIPLPNTDQDMNIGILTSNMCKKYAQDPRTIILCVMPANQDLTTSEALKMAMVEDPKGDRTIGVLTKIDIIGPGSSAKNALLGHEVPLKFGYIGVKGRSQHDINHNMGVTEALKIEKEYFTSHPIYSTLPAGHVGTEALTQKLSKILLGHIKATLPQISQEIQMKINECEGRVKDLGEPLPASANEKRQLLWNMITNFTENFKNNINGKYDPARRYRRVSGEISGGAKIKLMYQNLFSEFGEKKATEHLSDNDINKAIVLHQGDSIPGFPSVDAFLYLITPLLKRLREPSMELLTNVHYYLESISSELTNVGFERFPGIIEDVNEIINNVLQEEREKTQELIENIIESERSYIFTNDIEYMTQRTSFIPSNNHNEQSRSIDPEKLFIDEMRIRLDTYYSIVLRNLKDSIPKIIGHFLVKRIQEKLHYTLINDLGKNDEIMENIGEPAHIIIERETLSKVIGVLKKAKLVLNKDPEFATSFKDAHNPPVQPPKQLPPSVNPLIEVQRESKASTTSNLPVSGSQNPNRNIRSEPSQQSNVNRSTIGVFERVQQPTNQPSSYVQNRPLNTNIISSNQIQSNANVNQSNNSLFGTSYNTNRPNTGASNNPFNTNPKVGPNIQSGGISNLNEQKKEQSNNGIFGFFK